MQALRQMVEELQELGRMEVEGKREREKLDPQTGDSENPRTWRKCQPRYGDPRDTRGTGGIPREPRDRTVWLGNPQKHRRNMKSPCIHMIWIRELVSLKDFHRLVKNLGQNKEPKKIRT